MQTTVEETDKHKVKVTIEVPPEEFGKDLERTYRRIAQQVRIPGFRKGRVPRQVIDAQIGRETVLDEFVEDVIPEYYRAAIRENELAPITEPDIDLETMEEGRPLVFTATVEVRPRLKLDERQYRGIRVERPSAEVSDPEVDEMLDRLRERFAELETVARPAIGGDYVVIDVRATIHEEEVPEATRPDYLYEIGRGEFGEALDTELTGKRAGDIVKFNDTLPASAGERAGTEVSFQVLLKEVKGKRLPAADDDFAKVASEFDTLEELRGSIREQMQTAKERQADAAVRDRALAQVVDGVEVDLPETLVDEETEHRLLHAKEQAEKIGMTLEDLLATQGFDELQFRSDSRAHAMRAIKADLVLEAVAKQEGLEVTAEELGTEVARFAQALDRDPKEVAHSLERSGQVVTLAGDIIRTKALDLIVEHSEIVPEGERSTSAQVAEVPDGPSEPAESDPRKDVP